MAEEETLPFMLLGCLVQTRESHLALWMLSVNPIHAGVFLVLLFKIHVAPRKKFIWWNFFEKS